MTWALIVAIPILFAPFLAVSFVALRQSNHELHDQTAAMPKAQRRMWKGVIYGSLPAIVVGGAIGYGVAKSFSGFLAGLACAVGVLWITITLAALGMKRRARTIVRASE